MKLSSQNMAQSTLFLHLTNFSCRADSRFCHNINRLLIVLISCLGLLYEGGLSDALFIIAVVYWLWLPECDAWLSKLIKSIG